jgi:hypothetical protein
MGTALAIILIGGFLIFKALFWFAVLSPFFWD